MDKKSNKKVQIDINNMGIDIDKNEYREIVLSNSNRPEAGLIRPEGIRKYFKKNGK